MSFKSVGLRLMYALYCFCTGNNHASAALHAVAQLHYAVQTQPNHAHVPMLMQHKVMAKQVGVKFLHSKYTSNPPPPPSTREGTSHEPPRFLRPIWHLVGHYSPDSIHQGIRRQVNLHGWVKVDQQPWGEQQLRGICECLSLPELSTTTALW